MRHRIQGKQEHAANARREAKAALNRLNAEWSRSASMITAPCPAGSGQEVGGKDGFFLSISGISRLIICLERGIIKLWFLKPSISNTVKVTDLLLNRNQQHQIHRRNNMKHRVFLIAIKIITEKTIFPVFKPWQNDNKGLLYGNEESHPAVLIR